MVTAIRTTTSRNSKRSSALSSLAFDSSDFLPSSKFAVMNSVSQSPRRHLADSGSGISQSSRNSVYSLSCMLKMEPLPSSD